MRNYILLLTATMTLAACGDQHPTSPNARSSGRSNGDVAPSGQGIGVPQAKPSDQVGFTQITFVGSGTLNVAAGAITEATATCPDGTTAIGGGINVILYVAPATPPRTLSMGVNGANGYKVRMSNEALGSGNFTYGVTAYCAS